ncbi:MAG: glycoside hydrolase family 97 protein [Bacteroidales bacterium]|nr:glycoside hydrolase family 97 protein [Bacteroidales bacterium]
MHRNLIYILVLLLFSTNTYAQKISVFSPNHKIEIRLNPTPNMTWSVYYKNKEILKESKISLLLNTFFILGENQKTVEVQRTNFIDNIIATVPTKNLIYESHYKGILFTFNISDLRDYQIEFRAYNDGVAYRFITNIENEVLIKEETMELNFPKGASAYFPEEKSFMSKNEPLYKMLYLDENRLYKMASLPVLIKSNGINMLFNENNLLDYPNMYLETNGEGSLKAVFPKVIKETRPSPRQMDRKEILVKEGDIIASTFGKRAFPWRSFIISTDDAGLIASNLSFTLAGFQDSRDETWIKPGRVVWDWYSANSRYEEEFNTGISTDTYKYYIDFAAKYGFEYILMGEGWSRSTTDIIHSAPHIRMKEIIAYANEKNVGVLLWVLWKPLNNNTEAVMKIYSKMGVKGIKVDYMHRNDQYMVNFYEKVAKMAYKYKLIVDFQGSFKPPGLRKTYPNVLSFSAVRGNEYNKWSKDITPEYTLQIPFIRMAAGPMNFAPGSMSNSHFGQFKVSYKKPTSMGTQTRQIAMLVVYESPLQTLSGAPTLYEKQTDIPKLISRIPTTWDETIVLDAKIGEKLIIARRKGNTWYLAGLTNFQERIISIKLSRFLPYGKYYITMMKDGIYAKANANAYTLSQSKVNYKDKIRIHMVQGGGSLVIFEPVKVKKKKKKKKKKLIKVAKI